MDFADKVIIITGASNGIGRATALAFARHGCYLAITGRDVENLNGAATLCKSEGAKDVLTIVANFENMAEVESVVTKTVAKYKVIHVVVNNAGMGGWHTLEQVKMDDFDRLFNVNLKSMVRITQQAMPYLVETKGNVVNVSSNSAIRPNSSILIYGMTKAAVNQFTKTIALEFAPKGVRVNAICPSFVQTAITRHKVKPEETDAYYARARLEIPLGQLGDVKDCVNAILFLASSQSAWTTGQCLVLDGGKGLTSKASNIAQLP